MKKYMKIAAGAFFVSAAMLGGCKSYPIDEDGLLITDRHVAAMTSFELLGENHQSVKTTNITWDTIDGKSEVKVEVFYGTNLKNLKPSCGTSTDCIVRPVMGVWTDFSNLDNPLKYTIISGDRQVSREYTIIVTVQKLN